MKRTWEFAVAGFFLFFILGVLAVAFLTLDDRNDLVTEHYYDAEIQYQQQIDRVDRTKALNEQPSIELVAEGVRIRFPKDFQRGDLTGTVHVYRPDDKRLDLMIPIGPDSANRQLIPIGLLQPGSWNVQVMWNGRSVGYYSEGKFLVGSTR
ncbi:MAG: FixH family protein [Bacteroidetes bacterium]|nr:FixH family protein [Bacteroidota bacterium]